MFEKKMSELKEKYAEIGAGKSNIIIWGMGHVSMLYDNAFKTANVNIYAYTSNDSSTLGGGV